MSDTFKDVKIAIFYQNRNQVEQHENNYTIGMNDIQNYNKSHQTGAGHTNHKTESVKEMLRVHVKPAGLIKKYVVVHSQPAQNGKQKQRNKYSMIIAMRIKPHSV
jgi:hypothetical protein